MDWLIEFAYGLAKFALAFLMCAIVLSKAGANFKKNQQVRFHYEGFWKIKYAVFGLAGLVVAVWLDAPIRESIRLLPEANIIYGTALIALLSIMLYFVAKKERLI